MESFFTASRIAFFEDTIYFIILFLFLGKLFTSLLNLFVYAIEPDAKKKDKRKSVDSPILLLLAVARNIGWLVALTITSVIFEVEWFEIFFSMVVKAIIFITVVGVILYAIAESNLRVRTNLLSAFGFWYIRYHQKIQKNKKMTLYFKDGSTILVKEIFLLHTICTDESGKEECCYSNAELMMLCFNVGKVLVEHSKVKVPNETV